MSSSSSVVHLEDFMARRAGAGSSRSRVVRARGVVGGSVDQPPVAQPPVDQPPVDQPPVNPGRRGASRPSVRARRIRSCALPVGGALRQPPLVLTRRGRVVVTALATAAVLLALAAFGLLVQRAVDAAPTRALAEPVAATTITVGPGDTLWDIAARLAPGGDVRATVDEISRLNALSRAGDLEVGQRLVVPVAAR